jgi:hypothetical protein
MVEACVAVMGGSEFEGKASLAVGSIGVKTATGSISDTHR